MSLKCNLDCLIKIYQIFSLPCLFIYVTSGWITDTLKTVPLQTNPRLENLALYVENLPKQLEFETDQFGKLTKKILDEIDGKWT